MQWRVFEVQHAPGFRLSGFDLVFLLFLGALSWGLWRAAPATTYWGIPLYIGISFFQFCNVFRIGNRLEAYWYVPFVVIASYGLVTDDMGSFWWLVLLVLEPVKWGLVGYRLLRGSYAGIGYALVSQNGGERTRASGETGRTKTD